MDRYSARINLYGSTDRERQLNRLRSDISKNSVSSISCKDIKLNGEESHLIINTGTKPYYKEFQSLPNQIVYMGDYVDWNNNVWLIYEADTDDEVYIDGTLRLCNYKLFWQNDKGDIISRYAHVLNASSYNNGESENKTMTLLSNQYMVYLPFDEDTELLDNEKRIHMAKSNRKCRPYELTRVDDISYDYTDKGIINLMLTQDEYSPEHDKLVDDVTGNKVWICDYQEPATPPSPTDPEGPNKSPILLQAKFSCKGDKIIKAGGSAKTFSVEFSDENGATVSDVNYTWSISIAKEFEDLLSVETLSSRQCKIKLGYDDLVIGNYVKLSVLNDEGAEIGWELIEIGGNL